MKLVKQLFRYMIIGLGLLLLFIITTEFLIHWKTTPYMYDNAVTIPPNKVGLLLGTSKHTVAGHNNLYYKYRLQAAVKLFENKKIKYILVSGDNSTKYYDEPSTIKNDLVKLGIPSDRIVLDYAGFRTLDSVVRAYKVFGEDSYTVISQPFHNRRALYIAHSKDIDAIAYSADEVGMKYGYKVVIRERLARVKMMLDLLVGKQPKFLGDEIIIG